ncbi:MAG TPA: acetyl-CoA carboxylase carboxyltransferase subunit beta [Candidatus Acidoferrales bacterium]|nr:acetyl-CoA carboxylase carboxyltransferase subunit beta [Candidatus Acidoferrales bacterium]
MPPIELPTNCPGCGISLDPDALRAELYVCECGHHFPLHAEAWLAVLADEGTWVEHWADLKPHDFLHWRLPKPYSATLEQAAEEGLNEAVRTGRCEIGGCPVWLGVFDFRFVGGTLSVVAGERLVRGMERARHERFPYVLVTSSGGARMQEGVLALMQMAKVNVAVADLDQARVPYISILSHPTYGGTAASMALLGDVNLAEEGAAIGFTGPRVIKQATHMELPEGFQSADFQLEHGQVDAVVPRLELRARLAHFLHLYR